jgi:O-antigen ligase
MALLLPFANKLPLSFQRTLSILPVEVDPVARASAESSTTWRLNMWKLVLPQIPRYLLLGKGYGLKTHELEILGSQTTGSQESSMEMAMIAGDFHNGPLSVIIPFGIFGAIGFLWFLYASYKVLWQNYRYGDPKISSLNRFLLAFFVARVVFFFAVFGSLYSDMFVFCGIIGLSVALNGGVQSQHSAALRVAEEPKAA